MRFEYGKQHHYAIDQEGKKLVITSDGETYQEFFPDKFLANLSEGGGYVIGDGNSWAVRNKLSQSQFGWETESDLGEFLTRLRIAGWDAIVVPNKVASSVYFRYGYEQKDAVLALWHHVEDSVKAHGSYDAGHSVRDARGDNSFGQRAEVVEAFLTVQNTDGYHSPFGEDITRIAWAALPKECRYTFALNKTIPTMRGSLRSISAVACAVYDPLTGEVRTYNGKPWGKNFIVRRIIGLNGFSTGTGLNAPGNPMRAALRFTGRRRGEKINQKERSLMDKHVRTLIQAFQDHGPVRPISME